MKKYILSFIILFLFALPVSAEEILSFNVDMVVNQDSTVEVTERIDYDFGMEERHGIYREIPYRYKARGGNYVTDIDVIAVYDEKGSKYKTEISKKGSNINIRIGDANTYVSGKNTYVIKYVVSDALNYFDDYDEFYWNVTGNEWPVSIRNAGASVYLPTNVNEADMKYACYTGVQGSNETNCKILGAGEFMSTGLGVGEGMSIVVGFPKGIVVEPSMVDKIVKKVLENIIILLPIVVFILLFRYWHKHGRDPEGKGTVVPEYKAPVDILPAEGGVIIDEKMDGHDITATLIDLARRGYLKIKEDDKKTLGMRTGSEWFIIDTGKKDDEKNDLISFERLLVDAVFDDGKRKEVSLSKLKKDTSFGKDITAVKKSVYSLVEKNGWFAGDPEKVRNKYISIGVGIGIAIWVLGGIVGSFLGGAIFLISLVLTALCFVGFAFVMPRKTDEGVEMKRRLDGFKMFMITTEKDRVKFHFSPEKNPEKFADYLPWAVVFRVEKEWAKMFEGITVDSPDWYVGRSMTDFNVWLFANNMSSFDNSFRGAMTAASAGAAKGASGFSGGGFSGGGFGGGGGGSW